jgi:hypothetical protein
MFRTTAVVVLIFGLVLATGSRAEDERALTPGEKSEGEIVGQEKAYIGADPGGTIGAGTPLALHQANLKVKLKAGQAVSIKGTVVGKGRKIQLVLRDKTGKTIAATPLVVKSTILKMEELPSTGNYTVVVGSDQVGAFTVVASVEEELSESQIVAKIEALKEELKFWEAKLKEIQSKKP